MFTVTTELSMLQEKSEEFDVDNIRTTIFTSVHEPRNLLTTGGQLFLL